MSTRTMWWLSLTLNLLLAGWIGFKLVSRMLPAPGVRTEAPSMVVPSAAVPAAPEPRPQPLSLSAAANVPPTPFHWSQVESTDFSVYVVNLRALNCPERTVREIITAELDELYTRRRQEMLMPLISQPWDLAAAALRNPQRFEKEMKPKADLIEEQDRELRKEKEKVIEELLGEDRPEPRTPPSQSPKTPPHLRGYLAPEKETQMMEFERRYADKTGEIRQKRGAGKAANTDAQLAELDRQKLAEIRGLLSPEEYEEYQLRRSGAANLRYRVQGMEVSPDEWRQLAQRQLAFDEANPAAPGNAPDAKARQAERQKAQAQLDEQFKAVLGPVRHDEFKRAQQSDYQDALRVAERCELPAATAVQVFDVKRAAEAQARTLRENQALAAEERALALDSLRRQTEQSIRQVYGERGYQTYLNYRGDWLAGLIGK